MANKRRPISDLNHDNWNDEEEVEELGEFKKASEDELKNRTIKVAKRRNRLAPVADETDTTGAGAVVAAKPISSTAFSGFGGFVKTTGDKPTSAFSFLSNLTGSSSSTAAVATAKSTNGTGTSSALTTTTTPSTNTNSDKSSAYYGKLKGLNQTVSTWIGKHVETNPLCILTPIFDDYAKYLKQLESEEKSSADNVAKPVTSTFSFSSSTAKIDEKKDKSDFSFGAPKDQSSIKSLMANKGSSFDSFVTKSDTTATSVATAPTFSFGGSSTGFSFGGSSKPFSFANVAKPAAASDEPKKTDATNADDPVDEDEPPKVEFKQVVEKDSLYSKKCKVFVKGKEGFNDRGVGMLYLKAAEGSDKTQLIVRADTNLGNIILNLLLTEAIPCQRMGKNNVMMICIPTPDAKPPPCTVLVRVKNSEEADEVLEQINKYKK